MTAAPEETGRQRAQETWHTGLRGAENAGYVRMVEALRRLQDDVTAAAPPADVIAEVTRTLAEASGHLAPHVVEEARQISGNLKDVPGRGQAMLPPVLTDEVRDRFVRGRVTFGRYYVGGNGAAHGGALPLVFDELLGRLAATVGGTPSRTAYLHVNYRSITPIGVELHIEGTFDRMEGRKRFLTGRMYDGDTLCADAEGLFVELRPGQP